MAAICGIGFLMTGCGALSFVKSVDEDHGTYYRLKVKLTYKGERQDFNIIVGCNVRQIRYKDNSSTYEVGLVPTVFGRRMSDGKGLVIRPPDACDGETTANGGVQPDLLPVVVVYDDADTLTFGIAYLSEDAYDSPLSALKFAGATIETATQAEFDEFRRTETNLVKRESYHSNLESEAGLKRLGFMRLSRPFGSECQGYLRFRVPGELRPLVRKHWPDGKPIYWRPDTYEAEREITSEIWGRKRLQSDRQTDPVRPWEAFTELLSDYANGLGLATRTGGGLVSTTRGSRFPPSLYPATDDYQLHRWPEDRRQWSSFLAGKNVFVASDLDVRGGRMRGFAYCSAPVRPTAEEERLSTLAPIHQKSKVSRVDGKEVVSQRPAEPDWIFERDEYVFWPFRLDLESTRGDV